MRQHVYRRNVRQAGRAQVWASKATKQGAQAWKAPEQGTDCHLGQRQALGRLCGVTFAHKKRILSPGRVSVKVLTKRARREMGKAERKNQVYMWVDSYKFSLVCVVLHGRQRRHCTCLVGICVGFGSIAQVDHQSYLMYLCQT